MRILHPLHYNLRLSAFEFSDCLMLERVLGRSDHLLYVQRRMALLAHLMFIYKSVSPLSSFQSSLVKSL